MLSATPVNNRFNDLKNQLALAYEGNTELIDDMVVILERAGYFLDERIEQRNDPAVDLRALFDGNFRLLVLYAVISNLIRKDSSRFPTMPAPSSK